MAEQNTDGVTVVYSWEAASDKMDALTGYTVQIDGEDYEYQGSGSVDGELCHLVKAWSDEAAEGIGDQLSLSADLSVYVY